MDDPRRPHDPFPPNCLSLSSIVRRVSCDTSTLVRSVFVVSHVAPTRCVCSHTFPLREKKRGAWKVAFLPPVRHFETSNAPLLCLEVVGCSMEDSRSAIWKLVCFPWMMEGQKVPHTHTERERNKACLADQLFIDRGQRHRGRPAKGIRVHQRKPRDKKHGKHQACPDQPTNEDSRQNKHKHDKRRSVRLKWSHRSKGSLLQSAEAIHPTPQHPTDSLQID